MLAYNFVSPCLPKDSFQRALDLMHIEDTLFAPALNPEVIPISLYLCKVVAGFPSPADDYVEKSLDLNELLIKRPAATFFVRATGDSMRDAGIYPDDILIVDRSLTPLSGRIVVCALNGELTVKRFVKEGSQCRLVASNPNYPDIIIREDQEMIIWGVVTSAIHIL